MCAFFFRIVFECGAWIFDSFLSMNVCVCVRVFCFCLNSMNVRSTNANKAITFLFFFFDSQMKSKSKFRTLWLKLFNVLSNDIPKLSKWTAKAIQKEEEEYKSSGQFDLLNHLVKKSFQVAKTWRTTNIIVKSSYFKQYFCAVLCCSGMRQLLIAFHLSDDVESTHNIFCVFVWWMMYRCAVAVVSVVAEFQCVGYDQDSLFERTKKVIFKWRNGERKINVTHAHTQTHTLITFNLIENIKWCCLFFHLLRITIV